MRILLIGPISEHGSIPPYLDVLAQGLTALGAEVDRVGTTGVPYDTEAGAFWRAERIEREADALLNGLDLGRYDVMSVHFGNLEVEQLLPARWARLPHPPAVYHVHSLDWTLFSEHIPSAELRGQVAEGIRTMDGFLCFGSYAQKAISGQGRPGTPSRVSYLPTTIPEGVPVPSRARADQDTPLASLYGYPSTWKDPAGLVAAFGLMRHGMRFSLAGPGWCDPAQSGVSLPAGPIRYGPVELTVQDQYMGVPERVALTSVTDLAVFPYQPVRTFQGSGAIADYLANGVPVLATDVANMAELVGPAGQIIPAGDPAVLARALDRFAGDPDHRAALAAEAASRAHNFQPRTHAAECLSFYREVVERTT
jgi:glycosyltransferase involved in cell wall biosynthesis